MNIYNDLLTRSINDQMAFLVETLLTGERLCKTSVLIFLVFILSRLLERAALKICNLRIGWIQKVFEIQ